MNGNRFGSRGEAWVLIQALLFAVFLLAPRVGPAWPAPTVFRFLGTIVALAGIAVLGSSAVSLGKSLTPFPRPLPGAELVTSGAYRLVRHPIYFGLLLVALGIALSTLSPLRLVLTLLLGVFFDRKATREERWLLERYPGYPAYQAKVRKLVPYFY
ncbi:isoprenylcysteine carboxylmethyltransferase family protein [Massilia sp. Dwa41.01b]|uniref:methyltransferase family protein n=1 Tax=unclassified Massilia TaxID=2609279 RepID=UPI0016040C47|nr:MULTISPECIES: isoprenylcysteine carboxylmethyltransferase family protein [unclassified Massilia]QNA88704.1 isoprenylcysteine carboxylmethyltransferase family protein [Massilia sp. Dwa41.01b]QNA99603.1 isoprenylcysteine carboxylmethyltransferase family protein [Massilia sp. Se16.2.3]